MSGQFIFFVILVYIGSKKGSGDDVRRAKWKFAHVISGGPADGSAFFFKEG